VVLNLAPAAPHRHQAPYFCDDIPRSDIDASNALGQLGDQSWFVRDHAG
jgi:hypothetical protein